MKISCGAIYYNKKTNKLFQLRQVNNYDILGDIKIKYIIGEECRYYNDAITVIKMLDKEVKFEYFKSCIALSLPLERYEFLIKDVNVKAWRVRNFE